jgi:hypothetical protein
VRRRRGQGQRDAQIPSSLFHRLCELKACRSEVALGADARGERVNAVMESPGERASAVRQDGDAHTHGRRGDARRGDAAVNVPNADGRGYHDDRVTGANIHLLPQANPRGGR